MALHKQTVFRTKLTFHGLFSQMVLVLLCLHLLVAAPAMGKIVKTFRLQLGNLSRPDSAETLRQKAVENTSLPVFVDELKGLYKVTAGEFATYQEAAAYKDQIYKQGFNGAFVVEVMAEVSDKPANVYKIQVGNFASMVNAQQLQNELRNRGVQAVTIDRVDNYLKVRVGEYPDYNSALQDAKILQQSGYPDAWVAKGSASDSTIRRRIISMAPASLDSLTSDQPEMRPEALEPEKLIQIKVGPYTEDAIAMQALKGLNADGFNEVSLVKNEQQGTSWFLIGKPVNALKADAIRKTLTEKGYWNTTIQEVEAKPTTVAVSTPTPKPTAEPTVPQKSAAEEAALAHLRLARRLMDQGHYEAARDQYQLALDEDPTSVEAADGYSSALNAIREKDQFKESTQVALILELAHELAQKGEYNAARIQYNLALEKAPNNQTALEGLAQVVTQLNQEAQEDTPATPAVEQPQSAKVRTILRNVQSEIDANKLQRARESLQVAIKEFPANRQLNDKLTEVNRLINNKRKAALQQQPPEEESSPIGFFGYLLRFILVLIVLGCLGAGGFFFWQKKKQSSSAEPAGAQTKASLLDKIRLGKKKEAPAPKEESIPTGVEEYLDDSIPELDSEPDILEPEEIDKPVQPVEPEPVIEKVPEPEPPKQVILPAEINEPKEEPPAEPQPAPAPKIEPPIQPVVQQEPEVEETSTKHVSPFAPKAENNDEPVQEVEPEVKPEAAPPVPEPPQEIPKKPAHLLTEDEMKEFLDKQKASQVIFEQEFNALQVQQKPENWKGEYEKASLTISENPLISPGRKYLKFNKEICNEEVLFCMLIPDTGRKPVFEFELCCMGVGEDPLGLYLESVDSEEISLGTQFQTDSTSQQIHVRMGDHSQPYASGEWWLFRYELDLEKGTYNGYKDDKQIVEEAPLPSSVLAFDLISLKAHAEAEGSLLMRKLTVSLAD